MRNPNRKPRNPGMFKPGQSGNPSGRPKGYSEVYALARDHSPEAMGRLIELMDSDDERTALAAIKEILDRGWGKPTQYTDNTHRDEMSEEERQQLIQEARRDLGLTHEN